MSSQMLIEPERSGKVTLPDGTDLAWTLSPAKDGPIVVFLPGFRSDMRGTKATEVWQTCREMNISCLLLDYSGHGDSGGRFENGTIGRWTADALAVIDRIVADRQLLLVGSSMGGWVGLLAALARKNRVAGLIGIAAAPDFTETLMWANFTFEQRAAIMEHGRIELPNPYGEPTPITRALIEDGRQHMLLTAPIALTCPVRLLQGQRDAEVPWEMALRIAERLDSEDVRIHLVKDGDHRLSRPEDLRLLRMVLGGLIYDILSRQHAAEPTR